MAPAVAPPVLPAVFEPEPDVDDIASRKTLIIQLPTVLSSVDEAESSILAAASVVIG